MPPHHTQHKDSLARVFRVSRNLRRTFRQIEPVEFLRVYHHTVLAITTMSGADLSV